MNIHEFQAKELFRRFEVATPDGHLSHNIEETTRAIEQINSFPVVIKAQVHAGGRGKAGGVKLAFSEDDAKKATNEIIGMTLVTEQTGKAGKKVYKVLVEEGLDIDRELYLSIVPDRTTAQVMIVASMAGGMDIEEVAASTPEQIIRVLVNPLTGLQAFHFRQLFFGLKLEKDLTRNFSSLVSNLYKLFIEKDCTMLEINPLVVTSDGNLYALDAKVDIDSSSLYRHPDIQEWRDESEEDPLEVKASNAGLNYINLNGNIGNMVNGAGLAMATMDLIKKAGAEPANFLDVGGGASADMVEEGFRIILSDKKIKGILINIFGGILRCDVLAEGVVQAAKKTGVKVPVVIRMEGTNVEKGRQILADSGLNLITANNLSDAANKVAEIARN